MALNWFKKKKAENKDLPLEEKTDVEELPIEPGIQPEDEKVENLRDLETEEPEDQALEDRGEPPLIDDA